MHALVQDLSVPHSPFRNQQNSDVQIWPTPTNHRNIASQQNRSAPRHSRSAPQHSSSGAAAAGMPDETLEVTSAEINKLRTDQTDKHLLNGLPDPNPKPAPTPAPKPPSGGGFGCCGGAPPPEEPPPPETATDDNKVSSDEMDAIRKKLAEAKDKGGFKKEGTFRRKFDGFKAGGSGGHKVNRVASAEDKAQAEAINNKLRKDAEPANPFLRAFTRSFTRRSSQGGGGGGIMRSMSRMFTRSSRSRSSQEMSSDKTDADFAREHEEHMAKINSEYHTPAVAPAAPAAPASAPDASAEPELKARKSAKFAPASDMEA